MVQQLVTELDLDGDCMLDFTLFVKLIRCWAKNPDGFFRVEDVGVVQRCSKEISMLC